MTLTLANLHTLSGLTSLKDAKAEMGVPEEVEQQPHSL